jgi:hypothetical protein
VERLVSILNNEAKVVFDTGRFDEWCVYFVDKKTRYAPKDIDYLTGLKILSLKYQTEKLYSAFSVVYNHTYSVIDEKLIEIIKNISSTFLPEDQFEIEKWFTIIYAGMIAENNKHKTRLGKRIKHLAIHQLLIQNYTPEEAANFSRGKNWQELDLIMHEIGL